MQGAVNTLINELKKIGLEGARKVEEKLDDQFLALGRLYRSAKLDKRKFVTLSTINALVSFQLSCKGEVYWQEFSDYFASSDTVPEVVEALKEFLKSSRCNRRYLELKLTRLEKARQVERFLLSSNLEELYHNMKGLRDLLAKFMRQDPGAKTIVFAVKIFAYSMRASGSEFVPFPMEIDIPLDSRIQRLTARLGILGDPKIFWRRVAMSSGIPPLHLDSVLWTLLGTSREKLVSKLGHEPELLNTLLKVRSLILK